MKNKKTSVVAILAVFGLTIVSSGCSSIGNIIISPHPLSLKEAPPQLTLTDSCKKTYALPLAAMAAGIVVAGVQKFLEEEAKQYSASYSATNHISDLNCLGDIDFKKGGKEKPLYSFTTALEGTYFFPVKQRHSRNQRDTKQSCRLAPVNGNSWNKPMVW